METRLITVMEVFFIISKNDFVDLVIFVVKKFLCKPILFTTKHTKDTKMETRLIAVMEVFFYHKQKMISWIW